MLTLPIFLPTSPPSRPPSASPTAPVAFADSEPVTFSVPVSGVASDSTSWAPVAVIGPREAVQPISAFCRICDTGLSALPAKVRGAPRSAASRIAESAIATGAMMLEARGAGGSGGNSTSTGAPHRAARRQPVHRLQADEKRDREHRDPEQDRLEIHRQTHRPPGLIQRRSLQGGAGGARRRSRLIACEARPTVLGANASPRRTPRRRLTEQKKWRGDRAILQSCAVRC